MKKISTKSILKKIFKSKSNKEMAKKVKKKKVTKVKKVVKPKTKKVKKAVVKKTKKARRIIFKAPSYSKDSDGNSVIKVSDSWANHAYVNDSKYKKIFIRG